MLSEDIHAGSAMPLISIVVPIYNVAQLLPRCIDSILAQTYTRFELILVNDGSPDNCGAICDAYAQRDRRIKVIHKENGGLSDARNVGIDEAQGPLIMFVDSDDWIHEDMIASLYRQMSDTGAQISCCGFQKAYDNVPLMPAEPTRQETYTSREALAQFFTHNHAQMVVAWGKLYDKTLFTTIRYPKNKLHEDEFTTYKLLYIANKVAVHNTPYYYYYQRDDSIVGGGFDINKRLHAVEAHINRADFLGEVGYADLAAEAYRKAFLLSFNIDSKLDGAKSDQDVINFKKQRQHLKPKLRKERYQLRFRMLYECYYLFPKGIPLLHGMVRKI